MSAASLAASASLNTTRVQPNALASVEHQSFQAVGGIMVSGAGRVRGVRYPLVMPSQIAVVIKPVVASSSSGQQVAGPAVHGEAA